MLRTILKSKIHRASLTEVHLDYEGSIGIDECLLAAADIRPFELVHVFYVNNSARFQTYAINAQRDSGVITLNGAAARLGMPGDIVIILTFSMLNDCECMDHTSKVVYMDSYNRIIGKKADGG